MKGAPGQGSVTPRADGRFWARGPRHASKELDRKSLGIYDTEDEAHDAREGWLRVLAKADARTLPGATLRRHGERHIEDAARDEAPALAALRSRWKHILAAPFVDDALPDLRQPAIDAWARALRRPRGPLAPAYVSAILALLSGICAAAVREGTLAVNPCAGLRLPRERRTHEPWTYLEPDEQARLLVAPDVPEVDRLLITFAMWTGLREGELFALRLPDVHIEERVVVVRYGSDGGATKGGRIRRVPLFGRALEALERWLPMLSDYCPDNRRRLVWPGPRGGMRDVGHPLRRHERGPAGELLVRDGFEAALAAAGIVPELRHDGRPVRWHDLRHTFCSSLVAGWWGERWPLDHVREIAGHRSIRVTERYAHLAHSVVAEIAARTGGGVQVGYGVAQPRASEAGNRLRIVPAAEPVPLNPYFKGSAQNRRDLQDTDLRRTPPVPHEAAEALRVALAGGDAAAATEALRELVAAVPLFRDVVRAIEGGPLWAAAAARLVEAALDERVARLDVAAGVAPAPPRGRR